MTTFLKKLLRSPHEFVAALFVFNVLLIAVGWCEGLNTETWPGWVQGIGSLEAILVAVWIAWHQSAAQREIEEARERNEVRAMLGCLKTELKVLLAHVEKEMGPSIRQSICGTPFLYTFPLQEEPFPIYKAFIPKLGTVDSQLRTKIVHTYGTAQGFVSTFRHHNSLLAQVNLANEEVNVASNTASRDKAKARSQTLAKYSDSLRDSFEVVCELAADLVLSLPDEENA